MPCTIRSKNLDLIRWLRGGHNQIASRLERITNSSYVSLMARGEREIQDYTAKNIETTLGLPERWLDRDHVEILNMSSLDWEVHTQLLSLPDASKVNLLAFLNSIKSSGDAQGCKS